MDKIQQNDINIKMNQLTKKSYQQVSVIITKY